METIRLAEIPVEVLWEYVEAKREEVTEQNTSILATISTKESYQIPNTVTPLQLSVIGTNALITEGRNRIKAAMQSGCKSMLVNVSVFLGDGRKLFYKNTLERFKPINNDLALCLKKIFL